MVWLFGWSVCVLSSAEVVLISGHETITCWPPLSQCSSHSLKHAFPALRAILTNIFDSEYQVLSKYYVEIVICLRERQGRPAKRCLSNVFIIRMKMGSTEMARLVHTLYRASTLQLYFLFEPTSLVIIIGRRQSSNVVVLVVSLIAWNSSKTESTCTDTEMHVRASAHCAQCGESARTSMHITGADSARRSA